MNSPDFEQWLVQERSRQRKRGYPHFDERVSIGKDRNTIRGKLLNPKAIAGHRFVPFIAYIKETPKYKKTGELDDKGRAIRAKDKKPRPIAYASHWDALIYSWYAEILTARYVHVVKEKGTYACVSAYLRKGESNVENAHEAFEFIKSKGECMAMAFDLTSFFDTLDHFQLKRNWCEVLNTPKLPDDHHAIYKSITRYRTVNRSDLFKVFPEFRRSAKKKVFVPLICNKGDFVGQVVRGGYVHENSNRNKREGSARLGLICGVPQGSPISACLSNVYMLHFDSTMDALAQSVGGLYRRYSDDILFICAPNDALRVKSALLEELVRHELTLNNDKTEELVFRRDKAGRLACYDVTNGKHEKAGKLQYLGFEFDGSRVYIRSSSFSRYQARLRARIRKALALAHGGQTISPTVFRRKMFNRNTDKGRRNFITYARDAAVILDSPEIKRQIRNNNRKVKVLLEKMESELLARKNELRGRQASLIK